MLVLDNTVQCYLQTVKCTKLWYGVLQHHGIMYNQRGETHKISVLIHETEFTIEQNSFASIIDHLLE